MQKKRKQQLEKKQEKVQLQVNSIFTRAITEMIAKINIVGDREYQYEIKNNIYHGENTKTDLITLDRECLILIERYYSRLSQDKLFKELHVDKYHRMHVYYLLVIMREIIYGGNNDI